MCSLFAAGPIPWTHIVSSAVLTQRKSKKLPTGLPPPVDVVVQQFLGLANYYRRFVRDFTKIAKPLHRLTDETARLDWTSDSQAALEELRQRLISAPVLMFPDYSKPFILDTDASDTGIGAVLSQLDVTAYASNILSKAERQYWVTPCVHPSLPALHTWKKIHIEDGPQIIHLAVTIQRSSWHACWKSSRSMSLTSATDLEGSTRMLMRCLDCRADLWAQKS